MPNKIKWLLVADGERAKFLVQGNDHKIKPLETTHHADETHYEKDMGAHKPGATSHSGGGQVYAPHSDPHQIKKTLFAKQLADKINHEQEHFHELTVVAPAHFLGDLRENFSKEVQKKIVLEISKDLTKTPLDELASHLK